MSLFSHAAQTRHIPIFLLLIASLVTGILTFQDYGLSWDEPLFYEYADALGYAYTPANWFDPNFNLSNAYGASGDDHKTRGPAYLLLARGPVHLLISIGVNEASAWHLINFLTFLLGIYLLYRLSLRWMQPWAAFGAAALFSAQPLLWGHAFINPKDPPFMVFFTGAMVFGFEMVDGFSDKTIKPSSKMLGILPAAFFLGIASSIRILGPLTGMLIVLYAISRIRQKADVSSLLSNILLYILLATLIMFFTWPYLWEAPIARFVDVFRFMSENPTGLQVLFGGEIYRAYDLPRRYLPTLLVTTLTEPIWLLFGIGILVQIAGSWKLIKRGIKLHESRIPQSGEAIFTVPITEYWLTLLSFIVPVLYVILRKPPMYDGFRHFLFILPPIFSTCGLGLEWISQKFDFRTWLRAPLVFLIILPGFFSSAQLHPYEYTYYNSILNGTRGAFRSYETDYWLTCYKEAIQQFNATALLPANLFVHREAYIAAFYAEDGIKVHEERGNLSTIQSGDYILVNSRTNEDRKTFRDAPVIIEVGRSGAIYCVVKQIP